MGPGALLSRKTRTTVFVDSSVRQSERARRGPQGRQRSGALRDVCALVTHVDADPRDRGKRIPGRIAARLTRRCR